MKETLPENERFDCVKFKRDAQERLYEATEGMTPLERLEYYTKLAEEGPLGEARARAIARQKEQNRDRM